jgi:hypothetical protein
MIYDTLRSSFISQAVQELTNLGLGSDFSWFKGRYMVCWVNEDLLAKWLPTTNTFVLENPTGAMKVQYKWFLTPGYEERTTKSISNAAHEIVEQLNAHKTHETTK